VTVAFLHATAKALITDTERITVLHYTLW